ncbi:hypothetical protein TKK_0002861 [Trichogramma kaykai]
MVNALFDKNYFARRVDHLEELSVYLRSAITRSDVSEESLDNLEFLQDLVHTAMKLKGNRTNNTVWYRSLGEFFCSVGGLQSFLDRPIYKYSPIIAAATFLKRFWFDFSITNIRKLTLTTSKKIIDNFYGSWIPESDDRVLNFRRICGRAHYQAAERLVDLWVETNLENEIKSDIKKTLQNFLENKNEDFVHEMENLEADSEIPEQTISTDDDSRTIENDDQVSSSSNKKPESSTSNDDPSTSDDLKNEQNRVKKCSIILRRSECNQIWTKNFQKDDFVWAKWGQWDWLPALTFEDKENIISQKVMPALVRHRQRYPELKQQRVELLAGSE